MATSITATGSYLINPAGTFVTEDGVAVTIAITGTQSVVFARNTAPPGSALSLSNVSYLNGSLELKTAGTAITASGVFYITASDAGFDLYAVVTSTSGSVVVNVGPASINGLVVGADPGSIQGAIFRVGGPARFAPASTATEAIGVNGTAVTHSFLNSAESAYVDGEFYGANLSLLTAAGVTKLNTSASGVTRGGLAAAANTSTEFIKTTTAIANNVATAVLTITVPNAAHTAVIRLTVNGALGAGGAVGAGEASASNSYNITIVRTAGVNAVGTASSAYGAAAAAVAGAATVTATAALSAVSGAVGAVNTFTVNVTIARSAGSSDNHTCRVIADILNANATGITLS